VLRRGSTLSVLKDSEVRGEGWACSIGSVRNMRGKVLPRGGTGDRFRSGVCLGHSNALGLSFLGFKLPKRLRFVGEVSGLNKTAVRLFGVELATLLRVFSSAGHAACCLVRTFTGVTLVTLLNARVRNGC
jgi:hypothetical protein